MNVSRIVVLLFAVGIIVAHANETNLTLTVGGVTYSNVTFGTVTPSSVSIRHSAGISKVRLSQLPEEWQKKFNYNPDKEREFAEQIALKQKQLEAERELLAKRKAEAEANEAAEAERLTNTPITSVPLVGDETTPARIVANPAEFLNKEIIICGAALIANNYNYRFSNAANTHYSLDFMCESANLKHIGSLCVYCDRRIGKSLIDKIASVQEQGKMATLRLKVMVTGNCFKYNQFQDQVELVDWQRLKADRTGWSGWQIHPSEDR